MGARFLRLLTVLGAALTLAETSATDANGLLDILLRISGVSASPSQMKGPGDEIDAGELWVTDLDRRTQVRVTAAGYRWPVFSPSADAVVALRGDNLVRIPVSGGLPVVLYRVPGVNKLVGFDQTDLDKLLLLVDSRAVPVALLSLKSGHLESLPYDDVSEAHRRLLSHLRGTERVYRASRVLVKSESKQRMEGVREWTEVYVSRDNGPLINASACDGVNCGQPSMSPDGHRVVFVKSTSSG